MSPQMKHKQQTSRQFIHPLKLQHTHTQPHTAATKRKGQEFSAERGKQMAAVCVRCVCVCVTVCVRLLSRISYVTLQ